MNWKFWSSKKSPALPVLKCDLSPIEKGLLDHLVAKPAEWSFRAWKDGAVRADCAMLQVSILSHNPIGPASASCGALKFGYEFARRWHLVASREFYRKENAETARLAQRDEEHLKSVLKI